MNKRPAFAIRSSYNGDDGGGPARKVQRVPDKSFSSQQPPQKKKNTPPSSSPDNLPPLTHVQLAAVKLAKDPKGPPAIFITGEAGSGKSVTVMKIIQELKKNPANNVYVCATTGIAGLEINGITLASFMGTTIHLDTKDLDWVREFAMNTRGRTTEINSNLTDAQRYAEKKASFLRKKLQDATHLIVDEVSMLSTQGLENMDTILRIVRGGSSKPFGGLRVVFVGDFFQLPPVIKREDLDLDRTFAFQAAVWAENVEKIILPGTHRQASDPVWASMLSRIRRGIVDDEINDALYARVLEAPTDGQLVTHIYPHNESVDRINIEKLNELKGIMHVFEAEDETKIDLQFNPFKDFRAAKSLGLKVGAQVMLLTNYREADLQKGGCFLEEVVNASDVILANGSVGRVIRFSESEADGETGLFRKQWPVVHFPRGKGKGPLEVRLEPFQFKKEDGPRKPPIAIRYQVPLLLSYAISAHKSQGQTITCAVVADIASSFAFGQAYTMLSRVKSIDQLYLKTYHPDAIKAHPAVGLYYSS